MPARHPLGDPVAAGGSSPGRPPRPARWRRRAAARPGPGRLGAPEVAGARSTPVGGPAPAAVGADPRSGTNSSDPGPRPTPPLGGVGVRPVALGHHRARRWRRGGRRSPTPCGPRAVGRSAPRGRTSWGGRRCGRWPGAGPGRGLRTSGAGPGHDRRPVGHLQCCWVSRLRSAPGLFAAPRLLVPAPPERPPRPDDRSSGAPPDPAGFLGRRSGPPAGWLRRSGPAGFRGARNQRSCSLPWCAIVSGRHCPAPDPGPSNRERADRALTPGPGPHLAWGPTVPAYSPLPSPRVRPSVSTVRRVGLGPRRNGADGRDGRLLRHGRFDPGDRA